MKLNLLDIIRINIISYYRYKLVQQTIIYYKNVSSENFRWERTNDVRFSFDYNNFRHIYSRRLFFYWSTRCAFTTFYVVHHSIVLVIGVTVYCMVTNGLFYFYQGL